MLFPIKEAFLSEEMAQIDNFLRSFDLFLESNVDKTFYMERNNHIVGTISCSENVIKCFAVDPDLRSEGIGNTLISHMISDMFNRGIHHYSVFTKRENESMFNSLSLKTVAKTEHVALLENTLEPLNVYLASIKAQLVPNKQNAALVMNCNPMTKGHLHLITTCAKENEQVIVFLVEEDLSQFPFKHRYAIVKEATQHLSNVIVVPSSRYIISRATFPTYFLKNQESIIKEHALLDVTLFKTHFMPFLSIQKRYVGEEPYSYTTNLYNEALTTILGDQLTIIPRITYHEDFISASRVRSALIDGNMELVQAVVPNATYEFLLSDEGQNIIKRLKRGNV